MIYVLGLVDSCLFDCYFRISLSHINLLIFRSVILYLMVLCVMLYEVRWHALPYNNK